MFNILVTDDEQIVIDSLSFIINKNFADEARVFTALSGTEAIEIVMKENIDIMFMDINMPGLSGLETVSVITKLKPNIVFVILSAFDRFQYAQEAINLGAYKYITKPVNRNVVIETIRGAMQLVQEKQGKLSADMELHKKLDLVSPMIENDFIYACIYNNDKSIDLSSYLDYFNLTDNPWVFCCFEFPNINSDNQYSTYLKIHELLNTEHRCLVSSFIMNRIVVFFPIFSVTPEYSEIQEQIKKFYTTLSYNITTGIRAGVSTIFSDKTKLQASYSEALSALNKSASGGGLIFSDGMSFTGEQESTLKKSSTGEFKNQIINKLSSGDSNGVKSFLELFTSELISQQLPGDKIKNSFFELIVTANNATKEQNKAFSSDTFDNAFATLSTENDIKLIKEFAQKFLMECTQAVSSVKKAEENPIIKKVCTYVDENLSQDISLETAADFAGVSSFYLSKLFKEEKGETFINFISDKRLEKSRQLLSETNLSIKEITAEVGYNDQNYFSRIFKTKYGLSPKEYRKVK
ncbi:two-component system, response regulator YesN [Treponema bryantii]|uniref:Two-component system, response regulator YesN n=1 Tax=Treponema bryantii TaxID=163 RepID=A0A1H9E9A1_9SPIR|nr:response regulator [Treponema bryantii]BDC94287.1 DNA-binding response regulator [Treponema bryantii]SEQ22251.1 two-component system, response regulator YesN [Treponema bryantii]